MLRRTYVCYAGRHGDRLLEREGEDLQVVVDGPEARLSASMGVVAATSEVVAIAEALEDPGGWQGDGIVSPEQWVALRGGVSSSRARRLVSMARALGELPVAAAAFGRGALSEDQAALVCAHIDAAHDAEVTEVGPDAVAARRGGTGANGPGGSARRALPGPPARRRRPRRPRLGGLVGRCGAHGRGGDVGHGGHRAAAGAPLPGGVHVDADDPSRARLHLGPLLPASLRDYLSCDATGLDANRHEPL